MRYLNYLILILIILISLTFALLNAEPVNINYYTGSQKLPLSLLLAMAFFMGGLTAMIFSLLSFWRLKIENSRLQNRLKLAEQEIANLRVIPLKDVQ